MSNLAMSVETLSKRYRIGLREKQHETFTGALASWLRSPLQNYRRLRKLSRFRDGGNAEDVIWALRDVSFQVEPGEVVGVIGRNGAGKSTLLKILSRITEPTSGRVRLNGRVASLLEVGTGFHPDLTGRENVYLNGTILGMTKAEVDRKFDEIVAFSGVEKFIDTPVKRYSSGMQVRLAFAVAAHLEPEILVIDEVLAVGDFEFQRACLGKMESMSRGEGRTVLFVSHNMTSIKALCDRCMILDRGQLTFDGDTTHALARYQNDNLRVNRSRLSWSEDEAPGNEHVKILGVGVRPIRGDVLNVDSGVRLSYRILNGKVGTNLSTTVELRTKEDVVVFHKGTFLAENGDSRRGVYEVSVDIPPFLLNSNTYKVALLLGENQRYLLYRHDDLLGFHVENTNTDQGSNMNRVPGVVRPILEWRTTAP